MIEIKEGIVVCSTSEKFNILKNCNLKRYKFFTIDEFLDKLIFKVREEAVVFLDINYDIHPDVSNNYVNFLKYRDRFGVSAKFDELRNIYNILNENNFIETDEIFLNSLKDTFVTFYNFDSIDEKTGDEYFAASILEKLGIQYQLLPKNYVNSNNKAIDCYKFETVLDESRFIFNKIRDLLDDGVDFSKIKIANYNDVYDFDFKRLSDAYSIPINFPATKNILSTEACQLVLGAASLGIPVDQIDFNVINYTPFFTQILNIFVDANLYRYDSTKLDRYLRYKFKSLYYDKVEFENGIEIVDLYNYSPKADEYIFLMSCNSDTVPQTFNSTIYLNNEERTQVGIPTLNQLNALNKKKLLSFISSAPHLFVTYKNRSNYDKYFPANIIEELKFNVLSHSFEYGINESEDKLEYSLALDRYSKFNEKGIENNNFEKTIYDEINFMGYNPNFKGLDKSKLERYLPLKISPTHLKEFYQCPFKYYVKNILKLESFEDKTYAQMGTVVHKVFELYDETNDNNDKDKILQIALKELDENYNTPRMHFFCYMLADKAFEVCEYNKKAIRSYDTVVIKKENRININYDENLIIKGAVDKFYSIEENGQVYNGIVDYKTGSDKIDLSAIKLGVNPQLAFYNYLLTHDKDNNFIPNQNLLFMGLQHIKLDPQNDFKIEGYNNQDFEEKLREIYVDLDIFKNFDKDNYNLNSKEINFLNEIILSLILKARDEIMNGNFEITNKSIGTYRSCDFCAFSHMCHKNGLNKKSFSKPKDIHEELLKGE